MKTNSLSAWILAIRPYSLGNSVILILIGSALAFTDGGFRPVVALLCLVFAVTMQCTANLVNDLCDFLKGADRPDRLGPDRAFAKGYITLRAMKSGIAAFTLAACAAGAGLLALSGWNWWLLLVGASCIVFAYFYTAGPWPLAYHGMGDIAVILFFGLIPVGFTYYLQCGGWSGETAVVGLACGMVIDTMLMINNFRDREEDRRCNKRTIVVCLGAAAGRWGYLVLGTGAILLCLSLLAEGRIAAALLPLPYLGSPYRHMAQDGTHRPRRRTERLPRRNGPQHPALRRPADRRHPARQNPVLTTVGTYCPRPDRTSQWVSCPISEILTIPTQSRTQRPSHGRPTAPSPETDRPQTIDLPDRDSPPSQKREHGPHKLEPPEIKTSAKDASRLCPAKRRKTHN